MHADATTFQNKPQVEGFILYGGGSTLLVGLG